MTQQKAWVYRGVGVKVHKCMTWRVLDTENVVTMMKVVHVKNVKIVKTIK